LAVAPKIRTLAKQWAHPLQFGGQMKTNLGFWFALILLASVLVACSTSQGTATATTVPVTAAPTITPPPPTATAIPLAWKQISDGKEIARDTITAIAIDPQNPDVLYVGTQHAGVYKSIDGGQSWQPASKGLKAASITSLVIDQVNSSILYAGVTYMGIFKSSDGGETWENAMGGNYLVSMIYQSVSKPNILYARQGDTLWRSTNGATWIPMSYPCQKSSFAIHPQNGDIVFTYGYDCGGLFVSRDGGHTWNLYVGLVYGRGIEHSTLTIEIMPDGEEIYYLIGDESIFGRLLTGRVGDPYWWSVAKWCTDSLALNPRGGGYVFCNNEIFAFANGGTSKKSLTNPGLGLIDTITVSPHDANVIYAGGNGLARSSDGGVTWTTLNNRLGMDFARLIKPNLDADVFYLWTGSVCTSKMADYTGASYRSRDRGQTWKNLNRTGCSFAVSADGKTVFVVGEFHPNAEGYFTKGTNIWIGAEHFNSQIFRSSDYGQSWTALPQKGNIFANPVISGRVYSFSTEDNNKGSFSDDNGNTWQAMSLGVLQAREVSELYYSNEGKQIYAYANGTMYQSADASASWEWLSNEAISGMVIHPQNTENPFLTSLNGELRYLDRSGNSILTITPGFASPVINTMVLDPNHPDTVYAGTDSGAYISFDFGKTWGEINSGLPDTTAVYSIVVDKDSNVYAATPYGIFKLESQ
jgi:photosystem II stability/assembly factor-like uncharacterized protein